MSENVEGHTSRRPSAVHSRRGWLGGALAGAAAMGLVVAAPGWVTGPSQAQEADTRDPVDIQQPAPPSFADMVEAVAPAVVNIATTQRIDMADRPHGMLPDMPDLPEGTPFEEFFRRFFENGPSDGGPSLPQERQALGSGFIVDPDGFVVTNDHVVRQAEDIDVVLNDGRSFQAELIGRDPKTDLALLKIDADDPLPYAEFGDDQAVRIGDWVIAVGNPFGLGGTVTVGILSARNRDLRSGPYDNFLQIDAPINRGNSGGPTFNVEGDVIGVNTAIFSPSGGNIGIGFAVPATLAKEVIADLREFGSVRRGWLGVSFQPVSDEIADAVGLDQARGALVAEVLDGGPAAAAGLRQGDVIIGYDGEPLEEAGNLPERVAETASGSTVPVTVWRNGEEETLEVTIGTPPEEAELAALQQEEAVPEPESQTLGMSLAQLGPASRERFGLPEGTEGVVITEVTQGTPAAETGLVPGDVILQVNQEAVESPDAVRSALSAAREAGRERALMLIQRDGQQQFVTVPLAEA